MDSIDPGDVTAAECFLKRLNDPLYHRWLVRNTPTGRDIGPIKTQVLVFRPPTSIDPLLSSTLDFLTTEFLDYIEREYFVSVLKADGRCSLVTFRDLDLKSIFHEFLKNRYNDDFLKYRWGLISTIYNLKKFPNIPSPIAIREIIIANDLGLEVEEGVGFGDNLKDSCLFCGRSSLNFEVKSGFADFASQRPQSGISTKNPRICPVCILSVYVSLIRTSSGTGNMRSELISLKFTSREDVYAIDHFSHIFSRLLGISVNNYLTDLGYARFLNEYGKTAITHLLASDVPEYAIGEGMEIWNLSTRTKLDLKSIKMIKAFEPVIGRRAFWVARNRKDYEQEYRKALFAAVLGRDPFALIARVGRLCHLSGNPLRLLDEGIFELIKTEVIKMEERPDIIFGAALLIDAFLPKKREKDESKKTEIRKIAYYLERPEEVLYRLGQLNDGKDFTILKRDFGNRAQFKLLKELLCRIHEEEGYESFDQEQEERKAFVGSKTEKEYEDTGETLFLRFDDIIKVYVYLRHLLSRKYPSDHKKQEREYSELIQRIKYALIARRPELMGGE